MELARTLLKLWNLRVWMGIGVALAIVAAIAVVKISHKAVYSEASTQMIVDAQRSALGNQSDNLTPFTSRAFVYARLMTTPQVLDYIGKDAGIPGNLIAASGPTELDGPTATHVPSAAHGDQQVTTAESYKLNFLQNPELPTVDIYAEAPTTKQAMALANGAVTGFSAYMKNLDSQTNVPVKARVDIRQAGSATGGVVDSGANKKLALIAFLLVAAVWSAAVLFVTNLREHLRLAKAERRPQNATAGLHPSRLSAPPEAPVTARVDNESLPEDESTDHDLRSAHASNGTGSSDEVQRAWLRKVT